jgi:multidrug efflux pump subunit AcrB
VIPILLFSLIESKLILPAHLRHLTIQRNGDLSPIERWQQGFATGFENLVMRHYRPALEWVLRYRYPVLGLFVGVLLLSTAMLSSGWMKFVFFPKVQSEFANATLEMPVGTPFDITDRQVQRIVEAAQRLQREYRERTGEAVIVNILSSTGGAGSHLGNVTFEITPPEERLSDVSSAQLVNQWRDLIGPVPGAENLTYRAEIGRVSDPVDIQLSGPDFASLSRVADQIKARLADYPSVFDISDSFSDGKEALELVLKPEAQLLGLSREQILSQVRQGFFGYEVQRIQRGRDDVRVMVRYAEADRQSLRSLEEALIERPDGGRVPLSALVDLVPDSSPAQITRIDLQRTINVRADIDKQATNMLVLQRELSAYIDGLLQNHPDIRYTLEGEAREQRESFASLKWGLAVVLFVIYCLLAIPFGSYSQPFIVLTIIPFGAIGALAGHWIMGMDLTLISLLGLLALVGVVVNDSLVLVDFVNQRRAEHLPLAQVIREAAAQRFRPVVLTSLTTFFGLMPLLFEQSTQAQFLIPMAVSLGFGILFATVITLFLVPVNYMVLEDIRRLWAWLMQKPVSPEPETEQP